MLFWVLRGLILLHDNIQGPMQAVFYTPVRTDHTSCFGGADH